MLDNKGYVDNEVVMGMSPEHQALWNETFLCREKIEGILNGEIRVLNKNQMREDAGVVVAAYILAILGEYNNPFVSFEEAMSIIKDADIEELARDCEISKHWDELLELLKEHASNVFKIVSNLRNMSDPFCTPEGIRDLALRIMNVGEEDSFADLCCGGGTVARDVMEGLTNGKGTVVGFDSNGKAVGLAKAGNSFYGERLSFEKKDVFEVALGNKEAFDKIFANYPFRILRNDGCAKLFAENLDERIPSAFKFASSDWLFNMAMIDMLKDGGKAVGIMTNGATWNMTDTAARKYFAENGLIESVIALPAKLFGTFSVPVSLIVFSHGNIEIRIVDASKEFSAGRRVNELTETNVDAIMTMLQKDGDNSKRITLDDLRNNDYSLFFGRYAYSEERTEDGVAFGDLIKRITRGAQLNAGELDGISSQTPTNMQYLMLANVRSGLIDADLPYINKIDEKNKKYCLKDHCLILSKNGYPYKVAVANVKEGQTIMANGNLYIVELDETKVDPYYMAAYLSSDQGTAALKSITVGATLPNIGVDQLKKLIIPLPDMEKQKEIGERYVTIRDEIALLQLKIEKAKGRMAHVMEEGGDLHA